MICYICGFDFPKKDIEKCEECEATFCEKCRIQCISCNRYFCKECIDNKIICAECENDNTFEDMKRIVQKTDNYLKKIKAIRLVYNCSFEESMKYLYKKIINGSQE